MRNINIMTREEKFWPLSIVLLNSYGDTKLTKGKRRNIKWGKCLTQLFLVGHHFSRVITGGHNIREKFALVLQLPISKSVNK